ncbi:hypothetical protein CTAYLR_002487 [Chrysophaeum taylorii]|uniref:Micro-fibrillar-associated protein 1 C-terminal domain-containing protein n=1 Tax=Chrysophaeum taylorii TaxID=2483200 RepID=A0AAD7UFP2_9STRA|nr:hypothetical protein CTAYLR_002487 [Chrysophaeum taylorii]
MGHREDLFGLRELGLNLSTTQGDAASMRFTADETAQATMVPLGVHTKRDDETIGRRAAARSKKVTRYFPGQAPKWVKVEASEPEFLSAPVRRKKAEPVVLRAVPDEDEDEESSAEGDAPAPEPEKAEDAAARRARVREKLRQRAEAGPEEEEEEEAVPPEEPREETWDDDDESSTTSSSSSSEDEEVRPTFVPKAHRATIAEAEERERTERAREEREKIRVEERGEESRLMVARVVTAEETQKHFGTEEGSDWDAPDDEDDLDDPLEFEAWRLRELSRATRDKNAREAAAREAAETERRRGLTPAERAREDEASGRNVPKPKAKWKFLQKYHHKGAYFMDDDTLTKDPQDVRNRSTGEATGIDKFDREALPKVLQVKDFGFAGRTKYTHLSNEDTTFADKDYEFNGWIRRRQDDTLRRKAALFMGIKMATGITEADKKESAYYKQFVLGDHSGGH